MSKAARWLSFGRSVLIGACVSIVFPELAHRLWWNRHPGSEVQFRSQFVWYVLGTMMLILVGYLVSFYIQEYWRIFVKDSQEERHGLQR